MTNPEFWLADSGIPAVNRHILFRKGVACSSLIGRRYYSVSRQSTWSFVFRWGWNGTLRNGAQGWVGLRKVGFSHQHKRPHRDFIGNILHNRLEIAMGSRFSAPNPIATYLNPIQQPMGWKYSMWPNSIWCKIRFFVCRRTRVLFSDISNPVTVISHSFLFEMELAKYLA